MKPTNVLQFICPSGIYGAEMWILALARYLDPQFIRCCLAVSYETDDPDLEISDRFQNLGLQSHKIAMRGRFDPRAISRLARLIKDQKIDIIHTHGYKSDIIGLMAARWTGIKSLSTPHGFENARDFKLQTFIRIGCFALKYFDRVSPLSEDLSAELQRLKVKKEKIRLILNGVDIAEIKNARQVKISPAVKKDGEKIIGYVGQMAHRKNVGALIKAFDLMHGEHRDVRLMLIGDGPQRAELERSAGSLACTGKIEFLGYRSDRLKLVQQMDLFCMTSSLEGIPRCLMEAMALEVPVAAFDIPGVDKLILNEKTGLLAQFGDLEALKACWERILYNGNLGQELASNGRRHIEENFSAKRMADEYTALYREVAGHS
jgi:glycosyltransferase involved in cell wall biosynthesis